MPGGQEAPEKAILQRLTAEALGTISLPEEEVEVPALGGTVLIKAFSGRVNRMAREYCIMCEHGLTMAECAERETEERPACAQPHHFDEDRWEHALVLFGVVDPKLSPEIVETLFEEGLSGVGRMIAMRILSLNTGGVAGSLLPKE